MARCSPLCVLRSVVMDCCTSQNSRNPNLPLFRPSSCPLRLQAAVLCCVRLFSPATQPGHVQVQPHACAARSGVHDPAEPRAHGQHSLWSGRSSPHSKRAPGEASDKRTVIASHSGSSGIFACSFIRCWRCLIFIWTSNQRHQQTKRRSFSVMTLNRS